MCITQTSTGQKFYVNLVYRILCRKSGSIHQLLTDYNKKPKNIIGYQRIVDKSRLTMVIVVDLNKLEKF